MADISQEIQAFLNAKYGEQVRSAMVSAMNKINTVNEDGVAVIESQVQIDEEPTSYTKLKLETTGTDIEVVTLEELDEQLTETEIGAEVVDARTGYDETVYNSTGEAIRTQADNIVNKIVSKNKEFTIPRCLFYGQVTHNTDTNAYSSNTTRIASIELIFKDSIKIVSNDNNIQFNVHYTDTLTSSGSFGKTVQVEANRPFVLLIDTVDNTDIVASAIESCVVSTSDYGYEQFLKDYTYEIKYPQRAQYYAESNNEFNTVFSGSYFITSTMLGCRRLPGTRAYDRSCIKPCYSKKDLIVRCGYNSNITDVTIITNNTVLATLTVGMSYLIPKNTMFTFVIRFSTGTETGTQAHCVIFLPQITDEQSNKFVARSLLPKVTNTRTDSAFITENNVIYLISNDTGNRPNTYSVVTENTVVKSNVALGHTVGHANSCNYLNGKVYVSDWTDETLIHVFIVDDEEMTLTYEKDIVIPTEGGRTEYHVLDGEDQIVALGWDTGAADTANNLVVTLWSKSANTYVKTKEYAVNRPEHVVQGMLYYDGFVYYIHCYGSENSYTFIGVNRINLATGIHEMSSGWQAGTITSLEAESMFLIGIDTVMIYTADGTQFVMTLNI